MRVSDYNLSVITAKLPADSPVEASIAVGPEDNCACTVSAGDTHLPSTAPDARSFERILKSRLPISPAPEPVHATTPRAVRNRARRSSKARSHSKTSAIDAQNTHAPSGLRRVLIPTEWLVPVVVTEAPPWSIGTPDIEAGAPCPRFRVAMIACRRNLVATPLRVECVAYPFDCRVSCHVTGGPSDQRGTVASSPARSARLRPRRSDADERPAVSSN